jgi:putative phosphoribosyl transferase
MVRQTTMAQQEVAVQAAGAELGGMLWAPVDATGIVVFAHGSGSGRFSSRNRAVAQALNHHGFATLLFDLLTAEEHAIDQFTGEYRFDIPRLSHRLAGTVEWVSRQPTVQGLSIGLFGASTGAAAALVAAAERPELVAAVVSRGGRPDLAGAALARVEAPTLLVVGELDTGVISLNQQAAQKLRAEHETRIVPGATHLFEEPGTLEQVSQLASEWFERYLTPARRGGRGASR